MHNMAARAKNIEKSCPAIIRVKLLADFYQNSQEFITILFYAYPGMFRFSAQNGR
jgi:hypothetical protein